MSRTPPVVFICLKENQELSVSERGLRNDYFEITSEMDIVFAELAKSQERSDDSSS